MRNLLDRNELRRLEKAAREKDKKHLMEWAVAYEDMLRREYEKAYEDEIQNAIDNFLVAIVYTLHFNEKTKFGPKKLADFMEDLMVTVDMYRMGEYKPDEYLEELKKCGVYFEKHDWSKIYREKEGPYQKAVMKAREYLQTHNDLVGLQKILMEVDNGNTKL